MKLKTICFRILLPACLVVSVLTLSTGCATKNPNAGQVVVTTNPATGVTTTNVAPEYIPNSAVTSFVNAAGAAAPLVPPPYGTLLTALLALTTAGAGAVATWKNNQKNGLASQLTSVIQGVEAATTDPVTGSNLPAVSGTAIKSSIQSHATAAGVQPALAVNVQKITA